MFIGVDLGDEIVGDENCGDKIYDEYAGDEKCGRRKYTGDENMRNTKKVKVTDDDGATAESSCHLTVKVPSAGIGFVKPLQDQTVKRRTRQCLKWKQTSQQKWSNDADLDDTADYTIKVTDGDGATADSSCHLTVKLPAIEITKPLKDQTVNEGDQAVLD
uniref:Ig-like domain-containing protein n=1 Tax=Ditylenchus dipsaci TaxID=166011 RepID=A0A915E1G1_9BILA